jgi:hypothetical protein
LTNLPHRLHEKFEARENLKKNKLASLGFFTSHTNMVELMACEMNYKSLSIVIINSYINDNYESPMNQPINNNGTMLSQEVNLT